MASPAQVIPKNKDNTQPGPLDLFAPGSDDHPVSHPVIRAYQQHLQSRRMDPSSNPDHEKVASTKSGELHRVKDGYGEWYYVKSGQKVAPVAQKWPDVRAFYVQPPLKDQIGKPQVQEMGWGDGAWDGALTNALNLLGEEKRDKGITATSTDKAGNGPTGMVKSAVDDGDGDEEGNPKQTGAMVALFPSPATCRELSVADGESLSEMHLTLAFLGEAADLTPDQIKAAVGVCDEMAGSTDPIQVRLGGLGHFNTDDSGDVTVALIDSRPLQKFREKLVGALEEADVTVKHDHGFVPHITIKYSETPDDRPEKQIPNKLITLDDLRLCVAGEARKFCLGEPVEANTPALKAESLGPIYKSASSDEKRYTFSVLYQASNDSANPTLDAHKEWITPDELQKAQWKYVAKGKRDVYIQHGNASWGKRKAGEWVDLAILPFPIKADFQLPGEGAVTKSLEIPENSLWAGVVWDEWAWPLVKSGNIRGFSFGGFARRIPHGWG